MVSSPAPYRYQLLPGAPFLALSLAIWLAPSVRQWLNAWKQQPLARNWTRRLALLVCLVGMAYVPLQWGKIKRDHDSIALAQKLKMQLPPQTRLQLSPGMEQEEALFGYLYRYAYLNVQAAPVPQGYYLCRDRQPPTQPACQLQWQSGQWVVWRCPVD